MLKDYLVEIEEQECDEVGYDFSNIPIVVTRNLLGCLSHFSGATPEEILYLAHTKLLEKYGDNNIDYLQVFHLKKSNKDVLTFWCISNKEKGASMDAPYTSEYNMCFLLPEDY